MKILSMRVALLFIIAILLLSLSSCTKPYPEEPTDVAIAYIVAMGERDYNCKTTLHR